MQMFTFVLSPSLALECEFKTKWNEIILDDEDDKMTYNQHLSSFLSAHQTHLFSWSESPDGWMAQWCGLDWLEQNPTAPRPLCWIAWTSQCLMDKMTQHQLSKLPSYPSLTFKSVQSISSLSRHTGKAAFPIHLNFLFFFFPLHVRPDWAGWASHAGTSQTCGWG